MERDESRISGLFEIEFNDSVQAAGMGDCMRLQSTLIYHLVWEDFSKSILTIWF